MGSLATLVGLAFLAAAAAQRRKGRRRWWLAFLLLAIGCGMIYAGIGTLVVELT